MKIRILICLCLFSITFSGQTVLGVDTIYKSGPIDKRINIVMIGDGFVSADMPSFNSNVNTLMNAIFSTPPYKNYKKYFNIFAIRVVSPQSGVTHPGTATDVQEPASPILSVQNSFNTRFDNYGTHRSITAMNPGPMYNIMANYFPAYDQIIILGNSPEYGGTGGDYITMSLHPSSPQTVIHELGHSFAGLADEYWAGTVFATEKPNMTAESDPNAVKWSQWVGTGGIGVYPYGNTSPESDWFRPHQSCIMQFLSSPYCSVCKQTVIESIHGLSNPIDSYEPDNTNTIEYTGPLWLKTKLVKPSPSTLRNTWTINSAVVSWHADSLLVQGSAMAQGYNSIVFSTTDTTLLSRDPNHYTDHTYSVMWDVYYSTVGIKEIKARMEFSMFPNPAADRINLDYTLLAESEVGMSVVDINGKVVISEKSKKMAAGRYKNQINISSLPPGNYILALKVNEQTINNKFIITN